MYPHCFDADPEPDPAKNLDADPDPDPGGGGRGVGQPKMCIPPGKILGTPLPTRTIKNGKVLNITIKTYWYRLKRKGVLLQEGKIFSPNMTLNVSFSSAIDL